MNFEEDLMTFLSHADQRMSGSIRWVGEPDASIREEDAEVLLAFQRQQPWGLDAAIDLFDCDPQLIRDPSVIRACVIDVCERIHMHRYGEPQLVHFGDEPRVQGYTLVQLIETSAITAHFIEQANAVCINVFSCSPYRPLQTTALCQKWFHAREAAVSMVFRGPDQRELPPEDARSQPGL
jgi:S-adenosylmethionine/arginine decarboxylase-like enzyme